MQRRASPRVRPRRTRKHCRRASTQDDTRRGREGASRPASAEPGPGRTRQCRRNRPAPSDAPIEPGLADHSSAPVDIQGRVGPTWPPRQAGCRGAAADYRSSSRAPGVEAGSGIPDIQSPPVVQSSTVAPVRHPARPRSSGVEAPARTSEIPASAPCQSGQRRLK